jgi:kynureninase
VGARVREADRVRAGFARLLGCAADEVALAPARTSWSCASSPRCRSRNVPRLLTTDGEFHTLRRQLDRLAEARIAEVVKVAAIPRTRWPSGWRRASTTAPPRCWSRAYLFESAHIVPGLGSSPRPARAPAPSCSWTPTTT